MSKILFSAEDINRMTSNLALKIDAHYTAEKVPEIQVLVVLKAGFIFGADLLRKIYTPNKVHFVTASSYQNNVSVDKISLDWTFQPKDVNPDWNVLIIDTICDSGLTLKHITQSLELQTKVNSVKTCVLLNKISKRSHRVVLDFIGCNIPNVFVYGYGLDDNQMLRNKNCIYVKES